MLEWMIRAALIVAVAAGTTAASEPPKWLEGRAVDKQLASPMGASWSGAALGDVVAGLARTHGVAIVLDRRVDPQQKVSLEVFDQTLIDVLAELARTHNLGLYLHGPIACLTPPEEAARLETAARLSRQRIGRLPKPLARRWLAKAPMNWEELTEPAELLSQLSTQGGFTITNPQRLPHDLWAAGNLPKLSLADRLSFILGQFGLTYEISSDSTVKLVSIPNAPVAEGAYAAGKGAKLRVEKWKALAKKQKKARSTGEKEEIRIEKFTAGEVELEPLLRRLASRLGLTLELDREAIRSAGISLDRRVSISLRRVTPDELFEGILSPLGLEAKRRGKTIRIGPKP